MPQQGDVRQAGGVWQVFFNGLWLPFNEFVQQVDLPEGITAFNIDPRGPNLILRDEQGQWFDLTGTPSPGQDAAQGQGDGQAPAGDDGRPFWWTPEVDRLFPWEQAGVIGAEAGDLAGQFDAAKFGQDVTAAKNYAQNIGVDTSVPKDPDVLPFMRSFGVSRGVAERELAEAEEAREAAQQAQPKTFEEVRAEAQAASETSGRTFRAVPNRTGGWVIEEVVPERQTQVTVSQEIDRLLLAGDFDAAVALDRQRDIIAADNRPEAIQQAIDTLIGSARNEDERRAAAKLFSGDLPISEGTTLRPGGAGLRQLTPSTLFQGQATGDPGFQQPGTSAPGGTPAGGGPVGFGDVVQGLTTAPTVQETIQRGITPGQTPPAGGQSGLRGFLQPEEEEEAEELSFRNLSTKLPRPEDKSPGFDIEPEPDLSGFFTTRGVGVDRPTFSEVTGIRPFSTQALKDLTDLERGRLFTQIRESTEIPLSDEDINRFFRSSQPTASRRRGVQHFFAPAGSRGRR